MASNKDLNKANKAKKDEFYTMLADIEVELKHYRKHFKGKTVLCNCDDPFESNFFKYLINVCKASGTSGGLKNCPLWVQTLAFPPKSEFVENARSLKIRSFRQFIYDNLRIAVEVC